MSTSPLDFQLSLRQLGEGIRRQERENRRKQVDKTTLTKNTQAVLDDTPVNAITNKEGVPLNAQNSAAPTRAKQTRHTPAPHEQQNVMRIREQYKGSFLDVEVD